MSSTVGSSIKKPFGPSDDSQLISPFSNPLVAFALVTEKDLEGFTLHPLEEQALGEAVSPKRRLDFTLGRAAARKALEEVGFPVVSPVLRGEHREPL